MQTGKKSRILKDFKDGGGSLKNSGDDTINWCYESIDFPWFLGFFHFGTAAGAVLERGTEGICLETPMGMSNNAEGGITNSFGRLKGWLKRAGDFLATCFGLLKWDLRSLRRLSEPGLL